MQGTHDDLIWTQLPAQLRAATATPNGGYRVPCDRRAVTVGNEAMVGHSPKLALRLASATCPLKPACSCSFAADTFARPCSSVCSRDAMDQGSGARRRETPRLPVQDGCWTRWTSGAFVDVGRLTHNPEVAGSNPAPATNFRRSRPFSYQEEGLWHSRRVAKYVAATRSRAPRQRDWGDGVLRDETAWTWWTLPPAISGCLAQKYRRRTGVRAGLARAHTHAGLRLGGAATYCHREQIQRGVRATNC